MKQQYCKPLITVFSNGLGRHLKDVADSGQPLSHRDILGLVQDAFAEINGDLQATIAVKRQVLEHVSEGNFARAMRAAIVGASQVARPFAIVGAVGVTKLPAGDCGCTGVSDVGARHGQATAKAAARHLAAS